MLTASCNNCGFPKEPANYGDVNCPTCTTARNEAEQGFKAEHPEASESDVLYVGRQALLQRAHHANRNFTDPRAFSGTRGMIPIPPQTNRGSTE